MYKTRCSSIGLIMTNARSKKEKLSQTAKNHIREVLIQNKFGKYKDFSNRYTDKGNEVESNGIYLCNEVLNLELLYKNHDSFENDYITGTPDINTSDILIDIKSSWNAFTYFENFFSEKITNKNYMYQLQGYMWLTGKKVSRLCYCLLDTPEQIVEDEVRREHWKHKAIDENPEIREYVENNHSFENIPKELRVKTFIIEYDENIIEEIKQRVEECREYYNELNELLTIKEVENA
tara:strand:+ start:555 stop:1259 length:705 start_codon:yes stop_codon:yes gene_type:complete